MSSAKKIALITGANKGIGFEVARQIAKAGWTVLAGARNEELGKKAAAELQAEGLDVRFVHVDLNDAKTATAAAVSIQKEFGKLDVLVNNAAIVAAGDGPPSKVSIEALENIFQTNFIGTVAVTQAFLPLLEAAGKAQVINVSSGLGSVSLNNDPEWPFAAVKPLGYNGSKAALNMFTVQLAYEYRDGRIAVNAINPGYTATDLNNNSGTQTIEEGAAEIVRVALLENPPTGKFLQTGGELAW